MQVFYGPRASYRQSGAKNTRASAHADNYNFECDWLIQVTSLSVIGGAETNCGIARILGIPLMNSYDN